MNPFCVGCAGMAFFFFARKYTNMNMKKSGLVLKVAKWVMIVLGVVIIAIMLGYGYARFSVDKRLNKKYEVAEEVITVRSDSTILKAGKHQAIIRGCIECHGSGLQGKLFLDDPMLGRLSTPNLTKGQGGLGDYTIADWVRALKHGVKRNGLPIIFMPCQETAQMTEEDMAAVIAYCQSVPPVDNTPPANDFKPLLYVLSATGTLPLLSAERIDHNAPLPGAVKKDDALEHGRYLTVLCSGCHRENLKGGDALAPGMPPVPDITSAGHIGKWTLEQFTTVLRTGKTPEGKQLLNENMPWQMTAQYSETEIGHLYVYLQSIK
jgi:mono/diheme cytochrome c family protein